MKERKAVLISFLLFITFFILIACSSQGEQSTTEEGDNADKLNVVATTTIIGDVVSQVGADHIDLSVLLPVGTDPHSFDPTPQDIVKVAEADLVFASGLGLEEFLEPLIESAGAEDKVVHVSDGIDFLIFEDKEHGHENVDPHTWTDPNNLVIWVRAIERELNKADPENAPAYRTNAETYQVELESLDAWIREKVAQIPQENRKLVTDHALFGYFANEYGFEQVGALIPGYSTLSEPTAKELADIEDGIRDLDVKAVFVGNTVNPSLAERVSEDTGIQLIFVYTGSLSKQDGPAPNYLEYMRYNTNAFIDALK